MGWMSSKTTTAPAGPQHTTSQGVSGSVTSGSMNSSTQGWNRGSTQGGMAIDPTQRGLLLSGVDGVRRAAEMPFRQYNHPWTAGYRPELLEAGNMAMSSSGVGTSELDEGASMARTAGGYTPAYVSPDRTSARTGDEFMGRYFNPFLRNVGANMVDNMGRARQMQITADEDKAMAAGAYGGSRHGVMDAETSRGFFDVLGDDLTSMYAQGFQSAAGLGMQDADRAMTSDMGNADRSLSADTFNSQRFQDSHDMKLRAGQALAAIGDTKHGNFLSSAGAVKDYGALVQNYDQMAIDRDREKFNEWRNHPLEMAKTINGAIQGMPLLGSSNWSNSSGSNGSTTSGTSNSVTTGSHSSSGTSTGGGQTQTSSPSLLGQVGGLLGTAGAIGGLLFPSDEGVKSDVRELSDDQVLRGLRKTPVSTWRYDPAKGGPDDGGAPHIGPMAQGMKRNLGIGDGRSLPVVDVLGAHHAAISALAKKVDRKKVSDVKIKRKGK